MNKDGSHPTRRWGVPGGSDSPLSVILALVAGIQPRRVRAVRGLFRPAQQRVSRAADAAHWISVTSTGMTENGDAPEKQ